MGLSQGTGSRLVTKQNTAGELSLSVDVTSPGGGTYSSWGQLTASTGVEYAITGLQAWTTTGISNAWFPVTVQIGYGGSGAEAALGTKTLAFELANGSFNLTTGIAPFTIPWRVASGVRLATRVAAQNNVSGGNTGWTVVLSLTPWASLEGN